MVDGFAILKMAGAGSLATDGDPRGFAGAIREIIVAGRLCRPGLGSAKDKGSLFTASPRGEISDSGCRVLGLLLCPNAIS